ncbi:unnamed protein product, partial [Amoebophrya sp. A120]|eukprot:GSA120T00018626001.1
MSDSEASHDPDGPPPHERQHFQFAYEKGDLRDFLPTPENGKESPLTTDAGVALLERTLR